MQVYHPVNSSGYDLSDTRNPTATFTNSETSGGTGYLNNYGYDTRSSTPRPPYVMDIAEIPYRVSQWAEVQNPTGLPAKAAVPLASARCCAI